MGAGDGVVVPTDKLASTAEVLKALGASADQIADELRNADPPSDIWGVLGLLSMRGHYDEKAGEVRDHIRKIAEALDSQGGAVRACAERYEQLDRDLEQAFRRFQDKLAGGA